MPSLHIPIGKLAKRAFVQWTVNDGPIRAPVLILIIVCVYASAFVSRCFYWFNEIELVVL